MSISLQIDYFRAEPAPKGGEIYLAWREEGRRGLTRVRLFRSAHSHPVRAKSGEFDVLRPQFHLLYDSNIFLEDQRGQSFSRRLVAENHGSLSADQAGVGSRHYVWVDRLGIEFLDEQQDVVRRNGRMVVLNRTMRLRDQDLESIPYYYSLLVDNSSQTLYASTAIATDSKLQLGRQLYQLLPQLYRRYDSQHDDQDRGQLERLSELFGGMLDRFTTYSGAVLQLNDINQVPGPFLPLLAAKIGWRLDPSKPYAVQRNTLKGAHYVYKKVGTIPGIEALVYQISGKRVRVREFATNIFHSNCPENWYRDESGQLIKSRSKSVDINTSRAPARYGNNDDMDDVSVVKTHLDTLHYTFDSRRPADWQDYDSRRSDGWYSYDTVGLFLLEEASQGQIDLIHQTKHRYLPLNIRAILLSAKVASNEADIALDS